MHEAVKKFLKQVKYRYPQKFKKQRVCEFGSMDINGSVRDFFEDCDYTGVDWRAGKAVDVVSFAHEFKDEKKFDVIISAEMLEHDKYASKSIWNMIELLRPGGLLIITCAGPDRKKHEFECGVGGHYKNLEKDDVFNWVYAEGMRECFFKDLGLDLQMYTIKGGRYDEKHNNS